MIFDKFLDLASGFTVNGAITFKASTNVVPLQPDAARAVGVDVRDIGEGRPVHIVIETVVAPTVASGDPDLTFLAVFADSTDLTLNPWVIAQSAPYGNALFGMGLPAVGHNFEIILPQNITQGQLVYNRKYLGVAFYNPSRHFQGASNDFAAGTFDIRMALDVGISPKLYPASTGFPATDSP